MLTVDTVPVRRAHFVAPAEQAAASRRITSKRAGTYSSTSVTLSLTARSSVPPQVLHVAAGAAPYRDAAIGGQLAARLLLVAGSDFAGTEPAGTGGSSGCGCAAMASAFAASASSSASSSCSMLRWICSEVAQYFSRKFATLPQPSAVSSSRQDVPGRCDSRIFAMSGRLQAGCIRKLIGCERHAHTHLHWFGLIRRRSDARCVVERANRCLRAHRGCAAVGEMTHLRHRPQEAAFLQPLREQAEALSVPRQNLHEIAALDRGTRSEPDKGLAQNCWASIDRPSKPFACRSCRGPIHARDQSRSIIARPAREGVQIFEGRDEACRHSGAIYDNKKTAVERRIRCCCDDARRKVWRGPACRSTQEAPPYRSQSRVQSAPVRRRSRQPPSLPHPASGRRAPGRARCRSATATHRTHRPSPRPSRPSRTPHQERKFTRRSTHAAAAPC